MKCKYCIESIANQEYYKKFPENLEWLRRNCCECDEE